MQFIDPTEVQSLEVAHEHILELQKRLLKAESCLEDLGRSVEIAQVTRQYQLTEVFVREAEELLQDRLVMPTPESNGPQITMVETSDEAWQQGVDIFNNEPEILERKHGAITGVVDQDGEAKK
ncbi:MAG TPA: hypothetical protein VFM18_19000 [Methanosarcina sp.]|nr:hypothetical protein [Methanosarcina sp.]